MKILACIGSIAFLLAVLWFGFWTPAPQKLSGVEDLKWITHDSFGSVPWSIGWETGSNGGDGMVVTWTPADQIVSVVHDGDYSLGEDILMRASALQPKTMLRKTTDYAEGKYGESGSFLVFAAFVLSLAGSFLLVFKTTGAWLFEGSEAEDGDSNEPPYAINYDPIE